MFVVNVNLILILQLELNGDMNNVTFMVFLFIQLKRIREYFIGRSRIV